MVGLVHRILFDTVERARGLEAVLEVKRRAGLAEDAVFRLNRLYDDAEWREILASAVGVLKMPEDEFNELFARVFIEDALKRWPIWFQMAGSALELLELQPAIHNNFAAGLESLEGRESVTDKFRVESRDQGLIVHYRSPNRLCAIYRAVAREVLAHYGEKAEIHEKTCLKHGGAECQIHVLWTEPDAT